MSDSIDKAVHKTAVILCIASKVKSLPRFLNFQRKANQNEECKKTPTEFVLDPCRRFCNWVRRTIPNNGGHTT